jgi:hypothetical protein
MICLTSMLITGRCISGVAVLCIFSFTGNWMGVLQWNEETYGACQGSTLISGSLHASKFSTLYVATILAHSLCPTPRASIKAHQTSICLKLYY